MHIGPLQTLACRFACSCVSYRFGRGLDASSVLGRLCKEGILLRGGSSRPHMLAMCGRFEDSSEKVGQVWFFGYVKAWQTGWLMTRSLPLVRPMERTRDLTVCKGDRIDIEHTRVYNLHGGRYAGA